MRSTCIRYVRPDAAGDHPHLAAHAAHLCPDSLLRPFWARGVPVGAGEQGAGAAGCGVVDIDCGFVV